MTRARARALTLVLFSPWRVIRITSNSCILVKKGKSTTTTDTELALKRVCKQTIGSKTKLNHLSWDILCDLSTISHLF